MAILITAHGARGLGGRSAGWIIHVFRTNSCWAHCTASAIMTVTVQPLPSCRLCASCIFKGASKDDAVCVFHVSLITWCTRVDRFSNMSLSRGPCVTRLMTCQRTLLSRAPCHGVQVAHLMLTWRSLRMVPSQSRFCCHVTRSNHVIPSRRLMLCQRITAPLCLVGSWPSCPSDSSSRQGWPGCYLRQESSW